MVATSARSLRLSLNVPNTITLVRLCLSIPIALLILQRDEGLMPVAGFLLVVASLTDWLDGFVARRLKQSSPGGAIMDMVADQFLFMPNLIAAMFVGLFTRVGGYIPLNPYLYALPALAGGITVLAGIAIYLWKSRTRAFEFPTPTGIAKVNYWFWLAPLIMAVFGFGPDLLLAMLMYLSVISTVATFYSYLKKGSYVFTS